MFQLQFGTREHYGLCVEMHLRSTKHTFSMHLPASSTQCDTWYAIDIGKDRENGGNNGETDTTGWSQDSATRLEAGDVRGDSDGTKTDDLPGRRGGTTCKT